MVQIYERNSNNPNGLISVGAFTKVEGNIIFESTGALSAGYGTDNKKRFGAFHDGIGQSGIG